MTILNEPDQAIVIVSGSASGRAQAELDESEAGEEGGEEGDAETGEQKDSGDSSD